MYEYTGKKSANDSERKCGTEILKRLSGQSLELVTFSKKQAELFNFFSLAHSSLKNYKPLVPS
jgi:hypothetical protein